MLKGTFIVVWPAHAGSPVGVEADNLGQHTIAVRLTRSVVKDCVASHLQTLPEPV